MNLRPLITLSIVLSPVVAQAGLTSITIANPSFQADVFGGVGYAGQNGNVVTGWTLDNPGGIGVTGDQPGGAHFIDGSTVDGSRAGFIQGGGTYSQTISGLTPGQRYVFQGWFRARSTPGVPVFNANYGAQSLIAGQSVTPGAAWQAFSVPFIAGSASNTLSFSSSVPGGGDGALALDSIQVFQLDSDYVNILNPSFENGVSFTWPGYQSAMAGWTIAGGGGYNHLANGVSPFADNGAYPEGSTVAFLQNNASLSQMLTGLTPGQQYLLELDYNSRNEGDDGHLEVKLGGTSLLDSIVAPVGGGNAYHHLAATWTAGSASALLELNGIANGSDSSVVFDNITLRAIPEPSSALVAALGIGAIGLRRRKR